MPENLTSFSLTPGSVSFGEHTFTDGPAKDGVIVEVVELVPVYLWYMGIKCKVQVNEEFIDVECRFGQA